MTLPTDSVPALLEMLLHEREHLLAHFARIPEPQRAKSSVEGAWSAVHILEHCARVEGNVARLITKGAELPRTATPEELLAARLTEQKIGWVRNRATKVEAPERVHPTGTLDAAAAVAQLQASRDAVLDAFAAAEPAVLDGVIFPHPFIGPLTLRAWVELIAHHDARHAEQIGELLGA